MSSCALNMKISDLSIVSEDFSFLYMFSWISFWLLAFYKQLFCVFTRIAGFQVCFEARR